MPRARTSTTEGARARTPRKRPTRERARLKLPSSKLLVFDVPIGDVVPYHSNPNKGDVGRVAVSLQEYGWQQPIVCDPELVVIAGHTRLAAAQQLGMPHVPIMIAQHLSPTQIRGYRLADNATGRKGKWIEELLRAELEGLDAQSFNLELTGLDTKELDRLMDADKGGLDGKPRLGEGLRYRVMITCRDETHQRELLDRFAREQLPCRALMS